MTAVSFSAADHAFMAVPLPSGRHTVDLVYRPASFVAGAWISAAALAALNAWALALAWLSFRARRRAHPVAPRNTAT